MGQFIEPDLALETLNEPHAALNIPIFSGHKAINDMRQFGGHFRVFDQIVDRVAAFDAPYEDQCSSEYYFDLVRTLRDLNGEYDRVVEVGVYMGGASVMMAGCMDQFDFDLDLVDLNAGFLQFTYERIRRIYPEAAGRVRLYQGEMADYVRDAMLPDTEQNSAEAIPAITVTSGPRKQVSKAIIHHDGAHDFNQVVRDLTALSFVRGAIHSIIAQDTHLRGALKYMNFVDMALMAVFGNDIHHAPIGKVVEEGHPNTNPDRYFGNYFRAGVAEGMVIPLSMNAFQYPHPVATFEDIFGEVEATLKTDDPPAEKLIQKVA